MSHKVPSIYRQIDALEAKAEQLLFVNSLLVCMEFAEVRRTLDFGMATHARALRQLANVGESFWTTPSKPLQALLKQAYKAIIVYSRAQIAAEKARETPYLRQARFVRQLKAGVRISAAGSKAA